MAPEFDAALDDPHDRREVALTEDDRTPGPSADPAEETSDVDWPTWLRTRLEQGPRRDEAEPDSEVAGELRSLSQAVGSIRAGTDSEVLVEVRALRERVEAMRLGPDLELLAKLDALRESVAARPHGLDSVVARLDGLKETLVALPSDPVVMAELQELKEVVGNLHPGHDPEEARELQAIREAMASLPTALETKVVSRLESITEVVETLPTVPQLVSRLDALNTAVAMIPTTPDAEVAAGFHALRGAVNSFVEVVADIPGMVRRVLNTRSDELDQMVQRILKDKAVEEDGQRRIEASVFVRHHGVIERLEQLTERTSELAVRQAGSVRQIEGVGWTLERLVDAVRERDSEEGGLHLDETQIEAIAAAVTNKLGRADDQARPVRPPRGRPSSTSGATSGPVRPSDPTPSVNERKVGWDHSTAFPTGGPAPSE
jgi:hypothetical protein